jgi:hypothetical protein
MYPIGFFGSLSHVFDLHPVETPEVTNGATHAAIQDFATALSHDMSLRPPLLPARIAKTMCLGLTCLGLVRPLGRALRATSRSG